MSGVYISYPFCNQKCTFCNFASGVSSQSTRANYHKYLLAEIRAHRWDIPPDTIYFGGGTPSLIPIETLAEFLNAIPSGNLKEVTLECAPGTLTSLLAESWRSLGINRVSLGVQSFVDAELRQTGRRHTAAVVVDDVRTLRAAGISNVNIDLIAGLPGQTLQSWQESLDWIRRLDPPHVSVYIFEIDEDSRLGKEALIGGVRYGASSLPSEEVTVELYEHAVDQLSQMGLTRYEISNFAQEGYQSLHNLKYWELTPYIGFGLDAHSFDGRGRWSNPDTLEAYFARFENSASRELAREAVDHIEEHFFVGLRLSSGIRPSADEWRKFSEPIHKWLSTGMLEQDGGQLKLSKRGVLLSNEILQDFIHA